MQTKENATKNATITPKMGEISSYQNVSDVKQTDFPAFFPAFFPDIFPNGNTNPLENNTEKKSISQYFPKYSIRFYLHNTKSNTPTAILCYLNIDGKVYKHNTTLRVFPADWSKETQSAIIIPTHSVLMQQNYITLNNVINRLKIWFAQITPYICKQNRDKINDNLTKFIGDMIKSNRKPKEKVKEYFNLIRVLRLKSDKKTPTTANEYYRRISKLELFIKENKLSDNLYDFDYKQAFNFKEYLNDSEISYSRCKDILRTVKTLIKEISNDPNYSYNYDPKIESLEIDTAKEKRSLSDKQETQLVLSDSQIQSLESMELSDTKESQVRDLFILQCYTACRHSDLPKLLDPSNLTVIDGKEYVRYMDKKEGNRKSKLNYVNAPLFFYPNVKELWLKAIQTPLIIDIKDTNQFNRILKRIAKKSGAFNAVSTYINPRGKEVTEPQFKRIKSHCGRHTFITKWSEILTPHEIIYYTGHSDTDCIENNYLHRNENVINGHLARISNKLVSVNSNQQNTVNQSITSDSTVDVNRIIDEIQSLKDEIISPRNKELEDYRELFPHKEKYERIAEISFYHDIENVRRDFEEES